ncbi:hypothetical protein MBLNU459_g0815t1 [Dothideomycetes sp. NU459]
MAVLLMHPTVAESITRVPNTNAWKIGADILLIVSRSPITFDEAIRSWIDDYPETRYACLVDGDGFDLADIRGADIDDFISSTNTDGVWYIGSKFVLKAKNWNKSMEPEAETLSFVMRHLQDISIPQVLHSWIDNQWSRSFCLMTRCPGQTLQVAWTGLKEEARTKVAERVASICKRLAALESPDFKTATNRGIFEPLLDVSEGDEIRVVGPFSADEFNDYISTARGCPDFMKIRDQRFVFCHPDLGPKNILIAEDGTISIIDWDGAGYFPPYYVAAKTASHGFVLDIEPYQGDEHEWQKKFARELKRAGFPFYWDFWKWHDEWVEASTKR